MSKNNTLSPENYPRFIPYYPDELTHDQGYQPDMISHQQFAQLPQMQGQGKTVQQLQTQRHRKFSPQKREQQRRSGSYDFRDNIGCEEGQTTQARGNFPKTRKLCQHEIMPLPEPVQLSQSTDFGWNYEGRVGRDCCAVTLEEKESQRPGFYQLSGFDPDCQNAGNYANKMSEIMHFQKQYRNPYCYVDNETDLTRSELSNLREINQLFTRPYIGWYMGAGTRSLGNKDVESALQQGMLTNLREKPCEVTRGSTFYRYQCLPEFGNPQRVQHVVEPPVEVGGWIRGGDNTRDHVRRVDYQRRCLNRRNELAVHKVPNCGGSNEPPSW
jgi:hypothetical protein